MPYVTLKECYYHTVARNLFLNQEFFKILDIFSKKNIPLIPLKGIALIQKIYPDIGSRYIGDIDLLVKPEDVPKATNLLGELGYSHPSSFFNPEKPYTIYLNSSPFSKPPHQKFGCGGKPTEMHYFVHLHWHLLNTTFPLFMYRIDMKEVWQKAFPEPCLDKEILMMAPHHLIVYLSIHAFSHSFNKISLFYDIQKVIEFYKDKLNWKQVSRVAKAWRATLPLYYSLYLTSKILKIVFLKDILNIIRPKKISRMGDRIIFSISEDKLGTHNLVYLLYVEMAEGALNKIKFIFLSLFPPLKQLRRIYSVNSKYLFPFFYLKRLVWGLTQFIRLLLKLRAR